MASSETLTAVLTATENVSDALDDISKGFGKAAQAGEFTQESFEDVATGSEKIAAAAEAAAAALDDEDSSLRSASVSGETLSEVKDSVTISNEKLAMAARQTGTSLNKEQRSMMQAALSADNLDSFLGNLLRQNIITAQSAEKLADELDDVALSEVNTAVQAANLSSQVAALGVTSQGTQSRLDQLSDEMDGVGTSALGASLNIGPLNFQLRNLFRMMATIIPVAGALTTALLGIASAAVAAAAGIAMIFGGGVLAMAEGMAATSEEFESGMEAISEVLSRIGELFSRAMEPLKNTTTIEIFSNAMSGLATVVNYVAQAISENMEMFRTFFSEIDAAFWESFPELVEQTGRLLNRFMPILVDMFDWFMTKLPNAFAFMSKEGTNFIDTLGKFFNQMMDFFTEFTEIGIAALHGILPAIEAVISLMIWMADAVNALPNGLIAVIALLVAMVKLSDALVGVGMKLRRGWQRVAEMWGLAATNGAFLESVMAGMGADNLAQVVSGLRSEFDMLRTDFSDVTRELGAFRSKLTNLAGTKLRGIGDGLVKGITGASDRIKGTLHDVFTSIPPFTPKVDPSDIRNVSLGRMIGGTSDELQLKGRAEIVGIEAAKARVRELRERAGALASTLSGKLSAGLTAIRGGFARLGTAGLGVTKMFAGFGEAATAAFTRFGDYDDAIANMAGGLDSISPKAKNAADALWGRLFPEGIDPDGRIGAITNFGTRLRGGIERATSAVATSGDTLLNAVRGMKGRLVSAFSFSGGELFTGLSSRINTWARGDARSAFEVISGGLRSAFDVSDGKLFTGLSSKINAWARGDVQTALSPVSDSLSAAFRAGDGKLFSGLSDKINAWARGDARSAFEVVSDGLRSALDVSDGKLFTGLSSKINAWARGDVKTALSPISESLSAAFNSGNGRLLTGLSSRINEWARGDIKAAFSPISDSLASVFNSGDAGIFTGLSNRINAWASGGAEIAFTPVSESLSNALNSGNGTLFTGLSNQLNAWATGDVPSLGQRAGNLYGAAMAKGIAAKQAAIGAALNIDFTDTGIRDLDTGQFTSQTDALRKQLGKVKGAFQSVGGAAVEMAGSFKQSLLSVSGYDDAVALMSGSLGKLKTQFLGMIPTLGLTSKSYKKLIADKLRSVYTTITESTALGALQTAYGKTIGTIFGYISALWSKIAASGLATAANISLRQSLASVAISSNGATASMAATALSMLSVGGAASVAAAGVGLLSLALDAIGIGLIIKAVVALVAGAALLVGVLANLGAVTSTVGRGIGLLKAAIVGLFDFIVAVGLPVWNMLVDFFELLWSPIAALWEGFGMLGDAMGMTGENGGFLASVMDGLGQGIAFLNGLWKGFWNLIGGIFDVFANLLSGGIIAFFSLLSAGIEIVIGLVGMLIDYWKTLIDWFVNTGPIQYAIGIIQSAISTLMNGLNKFLSAVRMVFDGIVSIFEGGINSIIDMINGLISGFNEIPGVSIGKMEKFSLGGNSEAAKAFDGAKATKKEVSESAEGVGKGAKGLMSPGRKSVTNNVTKNEYNFGDFNMLPEEKARVKGLVKQAMRDANRNKRLEGGHIS